MDFIKNIKKVVFVGLMACAFLPATKTHAFVPQSIMNVVTAVAHSKIGVFGYKNVGFLAPISIFAVSKFLFKEDKDTFVRYVSYGLSGFLTLLALTVQQK